MNFTSLVSRKGCSCSQFFLKLGNLVVQSLPRTYMSPAGLGIFFLGGIQEELGREESNSNLPGK